MRVGPARCVLSRVRLPERIPFRPAMTSSPLLEQGNLLDVVSSDHLPSALLTSAFALARLWQGTSPEPGPASARPPRGPQAFGTGAGSRKPHGLTCFGCPRSRATPCCGVSGLPGRGSPDLAMGSANPRDPPRACATGPLSARPRSPSLEGERARRRPRAPSPDARGAIALSCRPTWRGPHTAPFLARGWPATATAI